MEGARLGCNGPAAPKGDDLGSGGQSEIDRADRGRREALPRALPKAFLRRQGVVSSPLRRTISAQPRGAGEDGASDAGESFSGGRSPALC